MVNSVGVRSFDYETISRAYFPRREIVQKIALESLAELAISLAITGLVCLFKATPIGTLTILSALAAQTFLNLTLRCISAFAKYKERQEEGENKAPYVEITKITDGIRPHIFSWASALNGQSLIHEGGHALAAAILYKGAAPLIEIYPFKGAETSYFTNQLTHLGQKFGKENASCITSASGPALALLASSLLLVLSFKIKETYPQVSSYLEAAAFLDFSVHISYALSALWTSPLKLSHDFVHMAKFGIHPLAAAVAITAIPVFITMAMQPSSEYTQTSSKLGQ